MKSFSYAYYFFFYFYFSQKVVPGDTLLFRVELLAPIRRGISTMKGYVFVGERTHCTSTYAAQNCPET